MLHCVVEANDGLVMDVTEERGDLGVEHLIDVDAYNRLERLRSGVCSGG